MSHRVALGVSLGLLTAACGVAPGEDLGGEDIGSATEPERWSVADEPGLFSADLERSIDKLPTRGAARVIPWAGSYWPMVQDSINYRWAGPNTASPARKYEEAFGGYRVEDKVSAAFGIDSHPAAASCSSDDQCNRSRGERCAGRAGRTTGRCIRTWFGICDGWAAAALLFPEPRRAVVYNGVTFQVQDIKALLSLVSVAASARGVSLKCRASDAGGSLAYDRSGRPALSVCRDTNPGTFHIILANYLGLRGRSFVEDRTFDEEVWNQPLRSYQVLAEEAISARQASELMSGVAAPYRWNRGARFFRYLKTAVWYIREAPSDVGGNLRRSIDALTRRDVYEYVLELDGAGTIVGGEWVGASQRHHPDYLWLPIRLGSASVAFGAIRDEAVKALVDASVSE